MAVGLKPVKVHLLLGFGVKNIKLVAYYDTVQNSTPVFTPTPHKWLSSSWLEQKGTRGQTQVMTKSSEQLWQLHTTSWIINKIRQVQPENKGQRLHFRCAQGACNHFPPHVMLLMFHMNSLKLSFHPCLSKLMIHKTYIYIPSYTSQHHISNPDVSAEKLQVLKHERLTHIFNPAAQSLPLGVFFAEYYDIIVNWPLTLLKQFLYLHYPESLSLSNLWIELWQIILQRPAILSLESSICADKDFAVTANHSKMFTVKTPSVLQLAAGTARKKKKKKKSWG